MKYRLIFVSIIAIGLISCNESINFDKTLNQRITEIEALQNYEFFVTDFPDSIQARFYNYESPRLIYHPYRFLRDTATIEELLQLTEWNNAFVRLYAFSALEERECKGLYQIILEHLDDTTKFYVLSDDHNWNASTIDMMIYYAEKKLTSSEKDTLKNLVITKHTKLGCIDNILFFLEPKEEYYNIIKNIAETKQDVYSLIALSSYQKKEDISIIMKGFDKIEYQAGVFIFFKAIENFPNNEFLPKLTEYGKTIKKNTSVMDDFMYYYYALAKYQDKETFKILSQMTDKKYYSSEGYWHSNLIHIYKALKKYECNEYKKLIAEILDTLNNVENKDFAYKLNISELNSEDFLNVNAWNYK